MGFVTKLVKIFRFLFFFLSGRKIKFTSDIAGYLALAQLALELFGRRSAGPRACAGIITIRFDIPVDLVEWPGSGGSGLCDGLRKLRGMRWVWEGEEVRMVKSLVN